MPLNLSRGLAVLPCVLVKTTRVRPAAALHRGALRYGDFEETAAPRGRREAHHHNVIVAKHLFNPSRSEGGLVRPPRPPHLKPTLLGVVVDGRRVVPIWKTPHEACSDIGSALGLRRRFDKITDDKVVTPDGAIDVVATRPKAPAAPLGEHPGSPGSSPERRSPANQLPGQPPMSPRAVRRLPVEHSPNPSLLNSRNLATTFKKLTALAQAC